MFRNADRRLDYTPLEPLQTYDTRPWYVRYEIPLTGLLIAAVAFAVVAFS